MKNTKMPWVLRQIENSIATLTLNRPETHNAFNEEMITQLRVAIEELIQDPEVKLLILKSIGKSFCAGADLKWMKRMSDATPAENLQDALALSRLMSTLYHCPKPTIAMVQGPTMGGGVGLVACCQIVIAALEATFSFSEVKLGLIPAVISPYILQAIGLRQTRTRFLLGTPFDALTAQQIGLCHEVIARQSLESRVQQIAQTLLGNGPQALQAVNHLLHQLVPLPSDIAELTAQSIANIRATAEAKEGLSAFFEKRTPKWGKAK